jgi:M6 family metalloprotease-like protein
MIKRVCLFLIIFLLGVNKLLAIPANPKPFRVQQPDGTYVTIRLHGDEYLHYTTTLDGYTLVKNEKGYYVYADYHQDRLIPTSMVAHDTDSRSRSESAFIADLTKHIKPALTISNRERKNAAMSRRRHALKSPTFDYGNFRGLVILVEFNDRYFSRDDFPQIANDMLNCENYRGYDNSRLGQFTGSVRDYFYDNSFGRFSPQFDVVGPVKIDYSQYDANGSDNALPLILAAIDAADDIVDYSLYDCNHDGLTEPICFIFAGYGSNVISNDPRLIWPHEWEIFTNNWSRVTKDGVRLGKYACSTELMSSNILSGIGTICHEFSHVLGLQDLYDTDDDGSGGVSYTLDSWSVMDAGCNNNNERTPPALSLYERYALGFTTPIMISEEGYFQLESVETSNTGFRLDTPVENEFFLLENRQQDTKWDAYLPGHGMLVFRVDSTDAKMWKTNVVNNNPEHNYFELLRAGGEKYEYKSDPFPGKKNVTSLTNETSPANLLTWNKTPNQFGLRNIMESDGNISFAVVGVTNPTYSLYKLTYLIDGEIYASYDIEYGAMITPEAEPTKEDYTFSGWSEIPETMPAHDVTIYGSYTTGIYSINIDSPNARIYNMQGNRLDKPQKGLNIIRMNVGTINKVIIK